MSEQHLTKRIGLYGPWGVGNLGCAATTDAMIQNIRMRLPQAQIYAFSLYPEDTQDRHNIPSFHIARDDWSKHQTSHPSVIQRTSDWLQKQHSIRFQKLGRLIRSAPLEFKVLKQTYSHLRQLDILIVTGGGQLLDFWGGTWTHPYWLFKFAVLSKLAGVKFLFVSVGAGPIKSNLSRLFIKIALSLATYRSYRDEESKRFVEENLDFYRDDPVYPDLAYSLQINIRENNDLKQPMIGLGVMAYYDPRYWPENDLQVYHEYLNKIASFILWLVERRYVVSLLVGESRADNFVVKDLIKFMNKKGLIIPLYQLRVETIVSLDDLLKQISGSSFVIASRLHNILLSTAMDKPVVALSYHPKIDSLMSEVGQSKYCLQLNHFDVESLKSCLIDLETNCETVKKHLKELTLANRNLLDKQYERIFENL